VMEIMEGARADAAPPLMLRTRSGKAVNAQDLKPEALAREIKRLEGEMLRKARNLEFEEAATLRDEIERLKQLEFGFPAPVTPS
jgi:excinuclease ABC subunit B